VNKVLDEIPNMTLVSHIEVIHPLIDYQLLP